MVFFLLVLDFDEKDGFDKFKSHCPDLAETYQVQTRRGRHLYYYTQEQFRQRGFKHGTLGAFDLKTNGMVVVPPSVSNGHQYTVIDAPIKTLSDADCEKMREAGVPLVVLKEPAAVIFGF